MTMINWEKWGPEPFLRAGKEKKPVLLDLFLGASLSSRAMSGAYAKVEVEDVVSKRYVPIRVDGNDRPDLWARYGKKEGAAAVVLDAEGQALAHFPFPDPAQLAAALLQCANSPDAPLKTPAAAPKAVWTGAVGPAAVNGVPNSDWSSAVVEAVKAEAGGLFPSLECLELLLYAACEWKNEEIKKNMVLRLTQLAQGTFWDKKGGGFSQPDSDKTLAINARLARLYLEAFSLTQDKFLGEIGFAAAAFIMREFHDPVRGAFVNAKGAPQAVYYADANSMAVLALLKAAAFPEGKKYLAAANQVLLFLPQMFDPNQGMAHSWGEMPDIYGLLDDNAWTMMAYTESFLISGHKPHREFADALLRHLFQELWEREQGGFVDRAVSSDDIGALKKPILSISSNAVAFEAAWRLHELKGNANYRKWIELGLKHLTSKVKAAHSEAAPLARILEIMRRGRLDLELVGKIGDAKTEALLAALHRHYLPRKIISFVDPDDQDYILAHKLEAPSYPRVFGCIDLRPKGDADHPDKIAELLKTLATPNN